MNIQSIKHKGLRRLMESGDPSGLSSQHVDKICKILAFLQDMESENELRAFPNWRPHRLAGKRKDAWSLSVTPNWRITFRIDRTNNTLVDLDYEDYH